MAIEVQKKDRENVQSLMRRFSKKVKRSGILIWARRKLFHQREKSRGTQRDAALRREKLSKEYDRDFKMSKVKE